jgi:phosphate/sulfate permease
VFLSTGAVIGLIAGLVIGVVGSGSVEFTTAQVIGYMAVIFGLLGMALGAVAYVLADRLSVRRARDVQAHVESGRPGEQDRRESPAHEGGERSGAAPHDRSADVGD